MKDRLQKAYRYLQQEKIVSTQESLGKKLGFNRTSVTKALNDTDGYLTDSFIEKFYDTFSDIFNKSWLLTGEGSMLKSDKNKKEEVREIDPIYMDVELIHKYAYAGYMAGYGDAEFIDALPKIKVLKDREVHGNYKCFEVRGDSMFDNSFESWIDGDVILCREVQRHLWLPKLHFNQWDFVIVHKDGILLKRIIKQDNDKGTITIHSLNPDKSTYPDQELFLNEIMQIFSVTQLVQRERRR